MLSCHIPFLVSSVEDFKDHIPRETDMKVGDVTLAIIVDGVSLDLKQTTTSFSQVAMNVYELSSAAGLPCEIDPALVVALSSQKSGKFL